MKRSPLVINTDMFPLDCVDPFVLKVDDPRDGEKFAKILVTFSHHTFTEEWEPGISPSDHFVSEGGDNRCFCLKRYNCALSLPGLLRYHVLGKAYETTDWKGSQKYAFIASLPTILDAYPIFFTVHISTNQSSVDGILRVASAYPKTNFPKKSNLQATKFSTIVGKEIGFPRRK